MFRLNVIRRAALRVGLRYAFFSSLWILFSDQAVLLAFDDPGIITTAQSLKGWAFVVLSAAIIYFLMLRELIRIDQTEKALGEQRSLLNAVLENSPAVMYLKRPDGSFITANSRFCDLFNQDPGTLMGRCDHELFPKSCADAFRKNDEMVLVSEETMSFQEEVPHPDGSVHTYLSVKFPVVDAAGAVTAICGISTDITEHVLMEERLQRTERLNALGRLTGGIAHDFNNHLTVIIGCFQLLQGSVLDEEERISLAREGSRASFQAASLIDRLLSFARNQILLTREVDINRAIREMGSLIARSLGETVQITYDLSREYLCANLDPVQLESAILNLAINARDAMSGGGTLAITTRLEAVGAPGALVDDIAPGSYICIDVTDTGEGMAPEVLGRVREPFFTTKDTGKGTGLGLSMVDGFARQSRGCVRIVSELGRGTTVSIVLPAVSASELEEQTIMRPEADTARSGAGEAILLVEDEPALRAFASRVLEADGYTVLQAEDATEAVSIMNSDTPLELLFSDIMLPGGMLGPELAQQFQARYPGKGVLLTSGYAEPGIWSSGPRAEILKKPYSRDALLAAVRALLPPH